MALSLSVLLTVYAVVLVGELPDKTAVATLVLGARYRALPVVLGVGAAFLVHVVVAVTAGGFVAALPKRPVQLVTAALFVVGAVLLLRGDPREAQEEGEEEADALEAGPAGGRVALRTDRQVARAAFGVVLVAEFGDLTQVLTATLAARYGEPLSVGLGSVLALWTVAVLAVTLGRTLLRVVPLRRVQQVAAVALLVLAAYSLVEALR